MKFMDIKHFLDKLDKHSGLQGLSEALDVEWCVYDDHITWYDENVYCNYIYSYQMGIGDYAVYEGDTGCGYRVTQYFPMDKKLSESDFMEKYGDQM